MECFALFDAKMGEYMSPFYSANRSTGVREIMSLLQNENHPVTIHAQDYTLYHLGTFDTATGEHGNDYGPQALFNLANLKENPDNA